MSAPPCSVDGCDRPAKARGFCDTDYRRARREGRLDLKLIIGDDLTRFWSHVRITGAESCWLWKGGKTKGGYPQFSVGGKNVLAHRWAYQEFVEEIPDGLTIDHVKAWGCTSRACVRPDHLQPVTNGENVLRGTAPTAINARKTHCVNGHEFTPENTRVCQGKRNCRTCGREWARRKKQEAAA